MYEMVELDKPLDAVAGHNINEGEWAAFNLCVQGKTNTAVCKKLEIQTWVLTAWQKQDWWLELRRYFFGSSQQQLLSSIISHDKALSKSYGELVGGGYQDAKGAAALVSALKLRLSLGEDPIIQNKMKVESTHNTQNNFFAIDIEKLEKMPEDVLMEMNHTGDFSRVMKDTNDSPS